MIPSADAADSGRILHDNLEALGARLPELAALLRSLPSAALEPVSTPSGMPSARLPGGAWLHSSRSPAEEARRLAKASLEAGADGVLLLGFGLGYLAEACLEAAPSALLACSADPGLLKAALGLRDLRPLLADERLGFVVGGRPEAIVTALELSGMGKASILSVKAEMESSPAWYAEARASAGRWNAKGEINENTLRRFGRLWVRNLARNLGGGEGLSEASGIEVLAGAFQGLPAIVLAAGPCLDEVLPWLGELRRKALLVCVDTALRSLLRQGVEPDFLVVVDPQYWNWRHLSGLASPSSLLVSESAAWPAVFRAPRRGLFLGASLYPLGRYIEGFSGERGRLGAGGSVATSAWDLCRILGCSPVWMAGLDLGFPGGATHARASFFEQRALTAGSRLSPAEGAQAAALLGGQPFEAPAAGGGRVLTDKRMSLYAWWFESRLSRPGSPPTRRLGGRGLAIEGMGLGRVEELLDGPDRRGEIEGRLGAAASLRAPEGAAERVAAGLSALHAELEDIAAIAEGAAAAAREAAGELAKGRGCAGMLAALDRADACLLGNPARGVAAFLLPPIREILAERPTDLGGSIAQSLELYRGLASSARYHVEALRAPLRGSAWREAAER